MNDAREGAFTGEIAALMLKEAGADLCCSATPKDGSILARQTSLLEEKWFAASGRFDP